MAKRHLDRNGRPNMISFRLSEEAWEAFEKRQDELNKGNPQGPYRITTIVRGFVEDAAKGLREGENEGLSS